MSICHTETLESRRLMSTTAIHNVALDSYGGVITTPTDAGPDTPEGGTANTVSRAPMTFSDGVLTVYGSPTDDQFHPVVSHRGTLSFELLRLAIPAGGTVLYDGTADGLGGLPIATLTDDQLPRLSDVKRIVTYAGDGNDTIDLRTLLIATEVHGGNGRDTIVGGAGDDTLYGEAGNDQLTDGRGHDLLAGGAGNDLLRNLKGADTLLGQGGNDRLVTYADESTLNGGAGDRNLAALYAVPDDLFNVAAITDDSYWASTPQATRNRLTRATLYRDDDGVLKLDVALTLPGGHSTVDWDLVRNDADQVTVDANFYLPGPGVGVTANIIPKTTYRHTFVLGEADRPDLTLTVRQGGQTKMARSVSVDDEFDRQTFEAVGELRVTSLVTILPV